MIDLYQQLAQSAPWRAFGWAMFHFLWVGGLLWLMAAAVRLALARSRPPLRYAAALALFGATALAPLSLLLLTVRHDSPLWNGRAPSRDKPAEVAARTTAVAPAGAPTAAQPVAGPPRPAPEGQRNPSAAARAPAATPVQPAPARPAGGGQALSPRALVDLARSLGDLASMHLPLAWLMGVPLALAAISTGLVGVQRLRRDCTLLLDGPIFEVCQRLLLQVGLAGRVAVAVSARVASPVLAGILRPLILLPPAVVTGCTPRQIEMILLHELAHVRRWDNLVNFCQRVVEGLLFFHPAVWKLSAWVRLEREHCCDAAVLAATGEPQAYAETLAGLAMPDLPPRHAAAAMAQKDLVVRIRHILNFNSEDHSMKVSVKSFLAAATLLAGLACFVFARALAQAPNQSDAKQAVAATTKGPIANIRTSAPKASAPMPAPSIAKKAAPYGSAKRPSAPAMVAAPAAAKAYVPTKTSPLPLDPGPNGIVLEFDRPRNVARLVERLMLAFDSRLTVHQKPYVAATTDDSEDDSDEFPIERSITLVVEAFPSGNAEKMRSSLVWVYKHAEELGLSRATVAADAASGAATSQGAPPQDALPPMATADNLPADDAVLPAAASETESSSQTNTTFALDETLPTSKPLAASAKPPRPWGSEQATGAPDSPMGQESPNAWAPQSPDSGSDWLTVEFDLVPDAVAIIVHQNLNPGAIKCISVNCEFPLTLLPQTSDAKPTTELYDSKSNRGYVREVVPNSSPISLLVVPFDDSLSVNSVRISLDNSAVQGYSEIDAVGLIDAKGVTHWAIRATASSSYADGPQAAPTDASVDSMASPASAASTIDKPALPPANLPASRAATLPGSTRVDPAANADEFAAPARSYEPAGAADSAGPPTEARLRELEAEVRRLRELIERLAPAPATEPAPEDTGIDSPTASPADSEPAVAPASPAGNDDAPAAQEPSESP